MYRVDDVARDKSPQSTFEKNGVQISFMQYYRDRYNITIRDVSQIFLVVGLCKDCSFELVMPRIYDRHSVLAVADSPKLPRNLPLSRPLSSGIFPSY